VEPIRFPAMVDSLGEAVEFVHALGHLAGLSDRQIRRLRLAAEELITNIVIHGYPEHGSEVARIELAGGIDVDRIWLRLIDGAPRFDPTAVAGPTDLNRSLTDRKPGGLGLFLARSVLDDLIYDYSDGHNQLTLVMKRTVPNSESARPAGEGGGYVRHDLGGE